MKENKLFVAEALIRWHHPDCGLIFPGDFIPRAEKEGMITDIGWWVLETLFEQQYAWQSSGTPLTNIAINIAGEQFQDPLLIETTDKMIKSYSVPPDKITYEITERDQIDLDTWSELVHHIEQKGILLSLDDFGTGFNTLVHLTKAQPSFVKVDRSFISTITEDIKNEEVIRGMIFLSERLGFCTIAEGVETKEQLNRVMQLGVKVIQGFYFDEALPATQFHEKYLKVPKEMY
ncbi:EAL domain-containing protein [Salipaludibacillus keqinensis]|uniref:EAL domain-containing protein n=1 Tax=Salipaludibacillus keqinensis TaxID=2045207 RepID=UPI001E4D471D|nr:EAL domain-containing protein [Salipaludibacillus keqinensis]